ncbi:MAG: type IX secretion system membrane protein PorP/SprF, partial [Bacteroidota bacterium]
MKTSLFSFFLWLSFCWSLAAQDALYTLFDRSPILLNPALTGDIPDQQKHRIIYQHRAQWFDALRDERYEHFAVAYDQNIPLCSNQGASAIGIGLQAISEEIPYLSGSPNYKTNKLALDLAYRRTLGKRVYFAGGFEAEWLHHRLDTEGLQFPSQYDGLGAFSSSTLSGELLLNPDNSSASAFSIGGGLVLTIDNIKLKNLKKTSGLLRIGSALHHLTRPNLSLVGNSEDQEATRSIRWTTHFRWQFPISDHFSLTPHGMYTLQGRGVWQFIGGGDFYLGSSNIPRLIPGLGFR